MALVQWVGSLLPAIRVSGKVYLVSLQGGHSEIASQVPSHLLDTVQEEDYGFLDRGRNLFLTKKEVGLEFGDLPKAKG